MLRDNGFSGSGSSKRNSSGMLTYDELKVAAENKLSKEGGKKEPIKDGDFGNAANPTSLYLKETRSTPLLTREGEIEIAKRIEGGQKEILAVLVSCPLAVQEVIR